MRISRKASYFCNWIKKVSIIIITIDINGKCTKNNKIYSYEKLSHQILMISEKLAIIPSITSKFTSVHYAYLLIFKKKIQWFAILTKKKHKIYLYHAFKIKRQCNWDCDIKNIAPSSPGPPEWGHTTISTLPNSRNIVSWTHPKLPRNLPAVPI